MSFHTTKYLHVTKNICICEQPTKKELESKQGSYVEKRPEQIRSKCKNVNKLYLIFFWLVDEVIQEKLQLKPYKIRISQNRKLSDLIKSVEFDQKIKKNIRKLEQQKVLRTWQRFIECYTS